MATSVTKRLEQIIRQERMDYEHVGPVSSLGVQYDRRACAWRVYDDHGDVYVDSVDEARDIIRAWCEAYVDGEYGNDISGIAPTSVAQSAIRAYASAHGVTWYERRDED